MEQKVDKRIFTKNLFFYFLLIIIAVLVFLKFSKIQEVLKLFLTIKPFWFLLAILAQGATYFFVAQAYFYILKIYHCDKLFSKWELFKLSIIILFVSQTIPSGGVSGNGFLVHYLEKNDIKYNNGLSIAILERFTYYLTHLLFLVLSFFYVIILLHQTIGKYLLAVGILGALIFIVIDIVLLLFGSKKVMAYLEAKIQNHKLLNYLFNKAKIRSSSYTETKDWDSPLAVVKSKNKFLLSSLFWQSMIILSDTMTIVFLFIGFNFHPVFYGVLIGFILTKIVSMLSIIPGSLVFFEGAMVLFYSAFGIPVAIAVVVTLLFRVLSFWIPIAPGLFLYKNINHHKKHLNQV